MCERERERERRRGGHGEGEGSRRGGHDGPCSVCGMLLSHLMSTAPAVQRIESEQYTGDTLPHLNLTERTAARAEQIIQRTSSTELHDELK